MSQYKCITFIKINHSNKIMFLNKRFLKSWSPVRNHKIDETVSKIGDILKDLEFFPQCRWIATCSIDCCMYHCKECSVNASMVVVLQDCYLKLKEIQDNRKE